ncbi:alpha-glucosidase C-terminal domain-containing protein [uncultured Anaerococcus sp.]|uniref:alpha-glucosidase C-terminal domain-containing protein n=1 Tax=uncultured Anaerococcus sp. TaxID=293428 RepID=UPI00288A0BA4|nr:alpha-glucosidase C-terminal domain-containing protein [uncultured Anaerococcus sp.]
MKDKIILKTDLREVKKLKVNIKFYQALGLDYLLVRPFERLDEKELEDLFSLNHFYEKNGLGLVISFHIGKEMGKLLGEDPANIDFADPKIRQGLYHFISYLIKYGIKGFDFCDLESLASSEKDLLPAIRELNKNTFFNREVLSMGEIDARKNTQIALANPNFSALSMIRPLGEVGDLFKFSRDFAKAGAGLALSFSNFPQKGINFENYPQAAKRLILMTLFFLKGTLFIEENRLDYNDIEFLRALFALKEKIQNLGKMTKILPKEADVLAFIREGKGEKILYLANLSEKEVLLDLAFKVMDYKDYHFLAGSISHRTLYRTLVLRPYEAVAFINCK